VCARERAARANAVLLKGSCSYRLAPLTPHIQHRHNQTCCINNGLGCKNQPVDSNHALLFARFQSPPGGHRANPSAPSLRQGGIRGCDCRIAALVGSATGSLSLSLALSVCEGNKGAKLLRSPQRCCFLPLLIRDWSCGCGSNFGCRVAADRTVLPGGVLLQPLDCLTN
jgi:hypothetical protein